MATTDPESRPDLDAVREAAFASLMAALAPLADAAEEFDRLVAKTTNPENWEECEVLREALAWRDDIAAARRYLAGHHRLVSS